MNKIFIKSILILLLIFSYNSQVHATTCVYSLNEEIISYIEMQNRGISEVDCYLVLDTSKKWFVNNNQLSQVPCGEEENQSKYMPVQLYCKGIDFSNNVFDCESKDDCDASGKIFFIDEIWEEEVEIEFKYNALNVYRRESPYGSSSLEGNSYEILPSSSCPEIYFDEDFIGNDSYSFDLDLNFNNATNLKFTLYGERMADINSFFTEKGINDMGQVNENTCESVIPGEDPNLGCSYTFKFGDDDYCNLSATIERDRRNIPFVNMQRYCTNGMYGDFILDGAHFQFWENGGEIIEMTVENNVVKDASCQTLYYNYMYEHKLFNFRASPADGYDNQIAPGDTVQVYTTSTGDNNSSNNNSNNSNNTPPAPSPGSPNDKYSGIESCTEIDVKRIKACGCIPAEIADITSKLYFILRIVGPVLLLILGGFDMAKAIASQDESSIEKAKKKLVNKFIAAAAIFLILTVIEFVVSLLAKDATGIMDCINILLDGYKI